MASFAWEVVDVFGGPGLAGNPAAVIWPDEMASDQARQRIAREAAFSETAFVGALHEGAYPLRWFTPETEVDLCGHATLAAAAVMHASGVKGPFVFRTRSGRLRVETGEGFGRVLLPRPEILPVSRESIRVPALSGLDAAFMSGPYLYVVFPREEDVRAFSLPTSEVRALPWRGLVITAPAISPGVDFVSRCFYPQEGIPEDPVTGSAHAALGSYWGPRLGREDLVARQLSERGGELHIRLRPEGPWVGGQTKRR